jgi:hypothetical protein
MKIVQYTWECCAMKVTTRHIHNQGTQKDSLTEKKTTKDYFRLLLHLLFHDYRGLVYDYN